MAVARAASLVYVLASGGWYLARGSWARPGLGAAVLGVATAWTVVVTALLARPEQRTRLLLGTDLAVAAGLLLAGRLVQTRAGIEAGEASLTLSWGAVPVVAWAVRHGAPGGSGAAVVVSAATLLWRGETTRPAVGSCVLLLLTGAVVGHVVALARRAEQAYARAVQREAAAAERERLARSVHDGVLQALALVAGRSSDPVLAGTAREQEGALRRLLTAAPAVEDGLADLRALLPAGEDVRTAGPAGPVLMPVAVARELADAVAACVDNVRQHAGGPAWLLVEDAPEQVTVWVRDEGPGIAPGRLAAAAAAGRRGWSGSVVGRVRDLGGSVRVESAPGTGTEVELRVPRR